MTSPIHGAVAEYWCRRKLVNSQVLARINTIYELEGFTGERGPGVCLGRALQPAPTDGVSDNDNTLEDGDRDADAIDDDNTLEDGTVPEDDRDADAIDDDNTLEDGTVPEDDRDADAIDDDEVTDNMDGMIEFLSQISLH